MPTYQKIDFRAELNGPQLDAVLMLEGPVLIIAGAGSGKTRVITYRIANMLYSGIPQSNILALTFTNKAAREMEKRIKELTHKKLTQLCISTFHAFGVMVLRDEIENLALTKSEGPGYRKNFSIYDDTDRMQLIKDAVRECRLSVEGVDLYKLAQVFSNIKIGRYYWDTDNAAPPDALTIDSSWENVYQVYQQSLKVFNALDFDDLLTLPIELFEKHPDIRLKYQNKYRYIMVDEFQDTSLTQYQLLCILAGRNVCVVGDDDQSIYSWRGANYENILKFEKDFPGTHEIKLEQNYRSTTTILEAANGLISNNTNRKEKRLWSGNKGGKPIELHFPENEIEEADFIVSRVQELRFSERLKYGDFGVLVRTNSMLRNIEESFLAANIPYTISGGTSFFSRMEIKDIISYLRVIANTNDDINLLRIINTPRRGIGKGTIAGIGELARRNRTSLWDAIDTLRRFEDKDQQLAMFSGDEAGYSSDGPFGKKALGELDGFISLIENFKGEMLGRQNQKGFALSQKVRSLTNAIDYWSHLVSEYSTNEKIARWKFANIENLIQSIETWERNPDTFERGLYPYLNRISLLSQPDDDGADSSKASLMTIHAAKGLEFPVVFIAGAEEGIIPHERSINSEDGGEGSIEEERRLFYVAITRARDKLYITSCKRRRRQQKDSETKPSPFLSEIPSHLIEQHTQPLFPQASEAQEADTAKEFFAMMHNKFK
ncbi:ATP-dependent helicase [Breznakiellaceae bacterium SP9]